MFDGSSGSRVGWCGIAAAAMLGFAGCTSLPRVASANARQAQYFATNQDVTPVVADAIRSGHVLVGMTQEQVFAAIGDPDHRVTFPRRSNEVWLYRAGRLHQGPHHLGTTAVRLIFVQKKLVLFEPF